MKVECLVCGYEGEPQKVRPQIRPHWLYGIAEIDKVCPVCGDTALEEVNTGKNNVVIHQLLPEPLNKGDEK